MRKLLNEQEKLKYRVLDVDGKVLLNNAVSLSIAEHFLGELSESLQDGATIVPITPDGKQVLFG